MAEKRMFAKQIIDSDAFFRNAIISTSLIFSPVNEGGMMMDLWTTLKKYNGW